MSKSQVSATSTSRRVQVAHACAACRGSKVKCSGERPTCTRCYTRGEECSYDVLEAGMTVRESMKRELSGNRRQLEDALSILDVMRYGNDMEATEMLARLRMGMDLQHLIDDYGRQSECASSTSGDSPMEGVQGSSLGRKLGGGSKEGPKRTTRS